MLHVVILAGGGGTRLWPLSRPNTPKQFLTLLGEHSLLQKTLLRLEGSIPPERVWIVTGTEHQPLVRAHLSQLPNFVNNTVHIVTEPVGRNTAAAIGLAAVHLQYIDPKAIMLVLPADHWIEQDREFVSLVHNSLGWAEKGFLVTFGIVPSRPETGYGYIQRGQGYARSPQESQAYQVERFVEKPPLALAKEYAASDSYYWNAGIFLWQAATIMQEIVTYLPPLASTLQEISLSLHNGNTSMTLGDLYPRLEPIAIDSGVLEKSSRLVVVPADIGWSDIGEWTAIHRLSSQDEQGNAVHGQTLVVESKNSFIYSSHRPIVAIGLSNLMVVEAEDAVLVCAPEYIQEVKTVGQRLPAPSTTTADSLPTVQRPWGTYTVLEERPYYKVKRLVVNPGFSLSLQRHSFRNEHWVIVQGTARVTNGEEEFLLNANQSTYIPQGTVHRLANPGPGLLEVIEVQTGSYFGEDDIVRYN
jgi:mannose-1-phosphate guanylyltransferase / mannose-6-phosphate isomerase